MAIDQDAPGLLISRGECVSDWEWLYHLFRAQERRWDRLYDIDLYRKLLRLLIRAGPEDTRQKMKALGHLSAIQDDDLQRVFDLRKAIADKAPSMNSWRESLLSDTSSPLEDAYHAGLRIAVSRFHSENLDNYYRGERTDDRDLRPSIYHPPIDYLEPDSGDKNRFEERLTNLRRLVDRLEGVVNTSGSEYSEDELVAIAQHYLNALPDSAPDVGTWLLDITSNPFTALFFATHKREAGDTGIVYQFKRSWLLNEFPVGARFRLVVPAGIPRIERQNAAFLEMHPEFLNQFISPVITFKQDPSILFEDPYLGITERRMFPPDDEIRYELRHERLEPPMEIESMDPLEFGTTGQPPQSNVQPPFEAFPNVTAFYTELVEQMVSSSSHDWIDLDQEDRAGLIYLSRFHAYIQRQIPSNKLTPASGINRLQDSVGYFIQKGKQGPSYDLDDRIRDTLDDTYSWRFDQLGPNITVQSMINGLESHWKVPTKVS